MTRVDDHKRPLGTARRQAHAAIRTRGRCPPSRLQIDDIAIVVDAVAGRQQEPALDLGGAAKVQFDTRRPARPGNSPVAYQTAALPCPRLPRSDARQGNHNVAIIAGLNDFTPRRPVQVDHDPRPLRIAAETDPQYLAHRSCGQPPTGGEHRHAESQQHHKRHCPLAWVPTRRIVTQQPAHSDGGLVHQGETMMAAGRRQGVKTAAAFNS